jgi:SanA protein
LKRNIAIVSWGIITGLFIVLLCNVWIYTTTEERVISDPAELPTARVALVLGTSPNTTSGGVNPYFSSRMESAALLYKTGKISHILVSGDNGTRYYNEPEKMKKALMQHGIPEDAITLDYAGFRTLDSIVRCKKVFGLNEVIVVTQTFHSYRALFIADFYDIKATAFVAPASPSGKIKVILREYLARTLAVWDLYVIHRDPKFLGEKETLTR